MTILLSIKKSLGGNIITLCDKNLFGKVIEKDGVKLTINEFYNGKEVEKEDIKKDIFEDTVSIHAIGEESVSILLKYGIINKSDIEYFGNIPIVLLFYV